MILKENKSNDFKFKYNVEIQNELLRFSLKESFLNLILEGNKDLQEKLGNLFTENPDR